MAWLDRLLGRPIVVDDWAALKSGLVEVEGQVEVVDAVPDPLSEESGIAIAYRAWPPSVTVGYAVADNRAFEVRASQAVAFLLQRGPHRVLIRPKAGEDLVARHDALVARYGVNLRAETTIVGAGETLRVVGRVAHVTPAGSPHRVDPYHAIIDAERFWIP